MKVKATHGKRVLIQSLGSPLGDVVREGLDWGGLRAVKYLYIKRLTLRSGGVTLIYPVEMAK